MSQPIAALALAAAVVVAAARPGAARLRSVTAPPGVADGATTVRPLWVAVGGVALGALVWAVTGAAVPGALSVLAGIGFGTVTRRVSQQLSRRPTCPDDDPADLAAAWAQLAVCLEIGLPVAAAVAAAAEPLDGRAGRELRRIAGLLELGADAERAWHAARDIPQLAAFARAAGRSAGTGAALARAGRAEGARLRAVLTDGAEARAQRSAVLIAAPLGLCFLPAFAVLGIAPVVIGLADRALSSW